MRSRTNMPRRSLFGGAWRHGDFRCACLRWVLSQKFRASPASSVEQASPARLRHHRQLLLLLLLRNRMLDAGDRGVLTGATAKTPQAVIASHVLHVAVSLPPVIAEVTFSRPVLISLAATDRVCLETQGPSRHVETARPIRGRVPGDCFGTNPHENNQLPQLPT
ncbi:hypothetical protein GQ53DRAFT_212909 [Thozetella sp. PMI_491]|nr:hypothetical protein GQ53DRAFT_212909 [Thozetella sp. PMI_491]